MNDNRRIYRFTSVDDLLQDDCFISSMRTPTKESELFWNKLIEDGKVDEQDFVLACSILKTLQIKPELISPEEIYTLWEDIEVQNKLNLKNKKKKTYFYSSLVAGIAASIVFAFILLTEYENLFEVEILSDVERINAPKVSTTDIRLILADDETILLRGKDAEIVYKENDITIKDTEKVIKKEQEIQGEATAYNQLIVPLGKRSMLTFNDGSRIWVNAGTRVVYPVLFKGNKREIFIDGEAFLEVSHDSNSPFIVKTKGLDVEVLGTSFNITAYEKDTLQRVVLVSGIVKVHSKSKVKTILTPNEMYTCTQEGFQVQTIDVEDYISWKYGVYQYHSECLGEILKRLARYYGKGISCTPQASQLTCSGKLDLKDDLLQVLDGISKTAPIQYGFNNETYLITHK